jgi:hypothetical protein
MPAIQSDFVDFFEEKKKGIYLCPVCASHRFLINVEENVPPEAGGSATLSEMVNSSPGGHS